MCLSYIAPIFHFQCSVNIECVIRCDISQVSDCCQDISIDIVGQGLILDKFELDFHIICVWKRYILFPKRKKGDIRLFDIDYSFIVLQVTLLNRDDW